MHQWSKYDEDIKCYDKAIEVDPRMMQMLEAQLVKVIHDINRKNSLKSWITFAMHASGPHIVYTSIYCSKDH